MTGRVTMTPVVGGALALVAAGSLVLFSVLAQQTGLQLNPSLPVVPVGPPMSSNQAISVVIPRRAAPQEAVAATAPAPAPVVPAPVATVATIGSADVRPPTPDAPLTPGMGERALRPATRASLAAGPYGRTLSSDWTDEGCTIRSDRHRNTVGKGHCRSNGLGHLRGAPGREGAAASARRGHGREGAGRDRAHGRGRGVGADERRGPPHAATRGRGHDNRANEGRGRGNPRRHDAKGRDHAQGHGSHARGRGNGKGKGHERGRARGKARN